MNHDIQIRKDEIRGFQMFSCTEHKPACSLLMRFCLIRLTQKSPSDFSLFNITWYQNRQMVIDGG